MLVDHGIDRHPPSVVDDGAGAIDAEADGHGRGVARHDLVDGVIHTLVDEVMKGRETDAADVHAGPFSDRLQPFQDLDRLRRIVAGGAGTVV